MVAPFFRLDESCYKDLAELVLFRDVEMIFRPTIQGNSGKGSCEHVVSLSLKHLVNALSTPASVAGAVDENMRCFVISHEGSRPESLPSHATPRECSSLMTIHSIAESVVKLRWPGHSRKTEFLRRLNDYSQLGRSRGRIMPIDVEAHFLGV
jgi:hypothetical protein